MSTHDDPEGEGESDHDYGRWPTYAGGTRRTGHHDAGGDPPRESLRAAWTAGDAVATAPAVVDDKFVGREGGDLVAYRVDDGAETWRVDLDGGLAGQVVAADGLVLAGDHGSTLHAVDADTGLTEWTFEHDGLGYFEGAPTVDVDRGTVYAPCGAGVLYALDLETGDQRWSFEAVGNLETSPVLSDGTLIVGDDRYNLYAVDAETGHQEWRDDYRGEPVDGAPAAFGGLAFVPMGTLRVYDVDTGETKWSFGSDVTGAAIADRTIYVVDGDAVYALDGTGSPRWEYEFDSRITSMDSSVPVVADGVVYVAGVEELVALDADTGDLLATYEADSRVTGTPVVAYGAVVTGTQRAGTVALTEDGDPPSVPEAAASEVGDAEAPDLDGWAAGRCSFRRTAAAPDATGPAELPDDPDPAWSVDVGRPAGACLHDGTVYALGQSGDVTAVDPDTSIASWERDLRGSDVSAEPVVADGHLIVGTDRSTLYALDPDSGEERWSVEADGSFEAFATPAVVDGVVYEPCTDDAVRAIDLADGRERWRFEQFDERFETAPAVVGDVVAVADESATLYGIDRESGERRWEYDLTGVGGPDGGPAVADGRIYVPTASGGTRTAIVALEPDSGTEVWEADLPAKPVGTPAVADGRVFVGLNDRSEAFVAIDAETGDREWSASFERSTETSPAVADGVVYVADSLNGYGLDAETGAELFRVDSQPTMAGPVVGDDFVVFSDRSLIEAYDEDSAREAADADAEGEGEGEAGAEGDADSGAAGSQPGSLGRSFLEIAADRTDDPEDPTDEEIQAAVLGTLCDGWQRSDRGYDTTLEPVYEAVAEQLPGAEPDPVEFNVRRLDDAGAIEYEQAFQTIALRARGVGTYEALTGQPALLTEDLLQVLQVLYSADRQGDPQVPRERLIEESGLDEDYVSRIVWALKDSGLSAGDLYLDTQKGYVEVAVQGADPWWLSATINQFGRQLFEDLR